jgi:hypothetical protein
MCFTAAKGPMLHKNLTLEFVLGQKKTNTGQLFRSA